MININDIKNRYEHNSEPKEVEKTRKLITKSFKNLEFVEDVHKYFLPAEDGTKIELPSVSSIIHNWEYEVDWDEIAQTKALKLGVTVDALKKDWHERNIISTHNGSQTHFFGENMMNLFIGKENLVKKNMQFQYTEDGYMIPYSPKEWAITQYFTDILNNPNVYPVMPEAKIYTNFNDMFTFKQPYAGTFDILLAFRHKGEIVYSIQDYKTNASLYKDFSRNCNMMMKPPFDDLYEEPLSHYIIQLNLYHLGLKQLGINVVSKVIIWLKEDGTYEKIRIPDITDKLIKELC
jgi:hypothetical protein